MTRDEYLAECKARALEYLDRGDIHNAVASMGSDLMAHEDLAGISFKMLPTGMMYVLEHDLPGARRWIEGFH